MTTFPNKTVIAIIAAGGLDPSAGAGLAVDIGAGRAAGAFVFPVATSVTSQNSREGRSYCAVEPEVVRGQLEAVLDDFAPTHIKIGMIGSAENVAVLADIVEERGLVMVLDPVLVSSTGLLLADEETVRAITGLLVPRAFLLTPNSIEAGLLTRALVDNPAGAEIAARRLYDLGAKNVIVTGGHLDTGKGVTDTLYNEGGALRLTRPAVPGESRGTGCAFASFAAGRLANGDGVKTAVSSAGEFTKKMIRGSAALGHGTPQYVF